MKAIIGVCFVGCTVIIIGNYIKNGKTNVSKAPLLAWLALLANSLQSGGSAILMRKIKGIHWITLNLYINIVFITLSAGTLGLQGYSFSESFKSFNWISIFLLVVISLTEISNKGFKLMAFRYQNPGKLSPYNYVYTIYGLIYDLVLFHVSFNSITQIGIATVFSAFVYHVFMMVKEDRDRQYKEEAEPKDDITENQA